MESTFHLTPDQLVERGYELVGGLYFGPRASKDMRAAISQERPLHIVARQSARKTARVNLSVARDAYEAADKLYDQFDIVAHDALPSKAGLASRLTLTTEVGSHIDRLTGLPFVCAYARIDLRPQGKHLFLTLVAGSASKLDKNTGRSPVVENLASDISYARPGLLFAKRQDRFFRQAWNQAPFWNEINALKSEGHKVLVGDGATGLWSEGRFAQAERLLSGSDDLDHASIIYTSTRASMVTYTGTDVTMVDGSVAYHLPGLPPPGLTRVRLVGHHPAGTIKRLYIDTPSNLPPAEGALSPLPMARDANGLVADQVATLRWYFSVAGPLWSVKALGLELIRRGMASDGVRARRGPAATYTLDDIYSLQETIWENLELYATGVMQRMIGGQEVVIRGLFPPDGQPWGSEQDFARMRVWLRTNKGRVARQVGATFTGVKCTRNGMPFKLISQLDPDRERTGRAQVRYLLQRQAGTPTAFAESGDGGTAAMDEPAAGSRVPASVRHEWLAQMVLDGLRRAQRVPVPLYGGDDTDADLAELRGAKALAETARTNLETNIEVLEHDIEELVPGTTRHVMPERVREGKWQEVEQLQTRLDLATIDLNTSQAKLDDYLARVTDLRRGLEANQVADVLVSLLDPQDTTHQRLWKAAIHDMTIQASKVKRCGIFGTQVDITFRLHISDGTRTIAIPTTSSHEYGPVTYLPERAHLLMDGLRKGIPMDRENSLSDQRAAFRYLRDHVIERPDGRVAFLHCREPELLRLGTRVLFPTADVDSAIEDVSTDADLLKIFSRPALLAHRLVDVYPTLQSLRGNWLLKISRLEVRALIIAASHQGRVSVDSFAPVQFHALREMMRTTREGLWHQISWKEIQLLPCPFCGSTSQLAMTFREVSGYVCQACRHDRIGVTWPAVRFDGYVARPDRWMQAGHALQPARPLPTESRTLARVRPRRYRKFTDLTPEQIKTLLHRLELGDSKRALAAQYGVSAADIRSFMRASQAQPTLPETQPSPEPTSGR